MFIHALYAFDTRSKTQNGGVLETELPQSGMAPWALRRPCVKVFVGAFCAVPGGHPSTGDPGSSEEGAGLHPQAFLPQPVAFASCSGFPSWTGRQPLCQVPPRKCAVSFVYKVEVVVSDGSPI